mmetsp:Transcript_16628/g.42531  ORF Transcript_16628/g.42531 Transcript_16628/m.42531 type:complete len:430 (-) Transcript_16628:33-1322(-)
MATANVFSPHHPCPCRSLCLARGGLGLGHPRSLPSASHPLPAQPRGVGVVSRAQPQQQPLEPIQQEEESSQQQQQQQRDDKATSSSSPASTDGNEDEDFVLASVTRAVEVAIASPLFYVTGGIALGVTIAKRFPGSANIVILSAIPLVGLSVLARTPLGSQLEERAAAQSAAYQQEKSLVDAARDAARTEDWPQHYGQSRTRWLPRDLIDALPDSWASPAHLDGTLPGDAGFDPLNLAKDQAKLARYRECELQHARWAMLALPGCIVPDAIGRAAPSLAAAIGEPVWWRVGEAKLNGADISWGGVGGFQIAGGIPIWGIALCQLVLMGGPEYARLVGIDSLEPVGVPLPGDINYPGGVPFDPLQLATGGVGGDEGDADVRRRSAARNFVEQAVTEMYVGRLAMLGMAGLFAQAAVTRESPIDNLTSLIQ